jgi:hypothetical protein
MTQSGEYLRQLREQKGYGYDRLSFLESWDSPWSESTWKRWELGIQIPKWEHLKVLVDKGVIAKGSVEYHRLKLAMELDWNDKYKSLSGHSIEAEPNRRYKLGPADKKVIKQREEAYIALIELAQCRKIRGKDIGGERLPLRDIIRAVYGRLIRKRR